MRGIGGCPMAQEKLVGNIPTESLYACINDLAPLEFDQRAWNHARSPRCRFISRRIKKAPNFSIEAVFKEIDFKPMSVHIDLFKLIDVNVDAIVFHGSG